MSHPKKKWGQHFLRNRGAVARIVDAVEPAADDVVLEIGPGEGVLTEKLAALPNELIAVEIDPELSERLRIGARHRRILAEATLQSRATEVAWNTKSSAT